MQADRTIRTDRTYRSYPSDLSPTIANCRESTFRHPAKTPELPIRFLRRLRASDGAPARRGTDLDMTNAKPIVRSIWRVVGTALWIVLPACSAIEVQPPDQPPPLITSAPAPSIEPEVITPTIVQTAGQVKTESTTVVPAVVKTTLPSVPAAAEQGKPLPINLPTALALSGANHLYIQIAAERLQAAAAVLDRANVMWLPNIALGVDYFRHDGQIQDVAGTVFTTSRSSLLLGGGPNA